MKVAAVAVLVVVAALAANAQRIKARPAGMCGRELWDLKTLSDPRRNLVYLRPIPTTVAAIAARRPPRRTPTLRARGFERHIWRVNAQITEYRLEDDSDIHMILFGDDAYMIAEMPSPSCLPRRTRLRRSIIDARTLFEQQCGAATDEWRSLGAVAQIDGVGFWDFPHGQDGHAENDAELHPVTQIKIVAGCA